MKTVIVKGLYKSYNGTMIFENAEMEIQDRGVLTAVTAPSGAGKTTLLNIIGGIEKADKGEIYIGDIHLSGLDDKELTMIRRRHIGFVFQFFNLFSGMTVLENVAFPLMLLKKSRKEILSRALDALSMVGMDSKADRFPFELSGGEQQRVAFARAIVKKPLLLLADEPTGNLDEENARKIFTLMRSLAERGTTILVVTHNLKLAKEMSHLHFVIRNKRIFRER